MIFALCVVVVVVLVVLYHEVIFAAGVAGWLALLHVPVLAWVRAHPWLMVAYVAGYFLVGAAWSVAKWWFLETDKARRAHEEWKTSEKLWADFIKFRKTNPASYRSEMLWWITFWPFSAAWTVLNDPIRRICRRIYDELQGVYLRITNYAWRVRVK